MVFSSLVQVSLQLLAARHKPCTGLLKGYQPHLAVGCLLDASWLSKEAFSTAVNHCFIHACKCAWDPPWEASVGIAQQSMSL